MGTLAAVHVILLLIFVSASISMVMSRATMLLLLFFCLAKNVLCLRCYSDHSGPNSAGGIEVCDEGGVCSSSRIVFREEGVLRTAMSRHCVARTPDRSFSSEWPWCHEEWAGGDEGGMEVYTCYCNTELCNQNSFLLPKFNEWISVTRARLKAGPSHPLDILTTIATIGVGGFFLLVVVTNIPWGKIFGKNKQEEEGEDGEEDQDEDESDGEEDGAHKKTE